MNQIKTQTKTFMIDGKEVPFRISGATPILYRNEFHKDMIVSMTELNKIQEDENAITIPEGAIESLLEMAYIMAKQGDTSMKKPFIDWLDEISFEAILNGGILEAVVKMFNGDSEQIVKDEKKTDQPSGE